MSSLDNIYKKMAQTMEPGVFAHLPPGELPPAQPGVIGRETAHELNNILTIIQGYAERMLMRHGDNPALGPDLQRISENARRAASVVRQATPENSPAPALVG